MDPSLDLETRRLLISTTLAAQLRRRLGRRVPADSGPGELLELAHELGEAAGSVERAYRLFFAPPYPGATAGAEDVGGSSRLLLACRVSDRDGSAIGVAFTALIAGRPHRCRWLRHRRPFHKVGDCRQTFTDTRPACEAGDPTTRIA